MEERAIAKWRRTPTPPTASGQASVAAVIAVPTDHLSEEAEPTSKPIHWISAAPAGKATMLDLCFIRGPRKLVERGLRKRGENLVVYALLPNGDAFTVSSRQSPVPPIDGYITRTRLLARRGDLRLGRQFRISAEGPRDGERRLRTHLFLGWEDNQPFRVMEVAGFARGRGADGEEEEE